MMQQVATQKPEVAALPIDVSVTSSNQQEAQGEAFASLLQQNSPETKASEGIAENAAEQRSQSPEANAAASDESTGSPKAENRQTVSEDRSQQDTADEEAKAEGNVSSDTSPAHSSEKVSQKDEQQSVNAEAEKHQQAYDELISKVDETLLEPGELDVDWVNLVEQVQKVTQLTVTPGEIEPRKFITPIREPVHSEQQLPSQQDIEVLSDELLAKLSQLNDAESANADILPKASIAEIAPITDELIKIMRQQVSEATAAKGSEVSLQRDPLEDVDLANVNNQGTDKKSLDSQIEIQASQLLNADLAADEVNELDKQLLTEVLVGRKAVTPAVNSEAAASAAVSSQSATGSNADTSERPNNADLVLMANLPEPALQKVAENIAARVAPESPQQHAFVAALQAGVKEFKVQLEQGREPGIDLKALVSAAAEKVSPELAQQMTMPAVEKRLQETSQLLTFTQQVTKMAESYAEQPANLRTAEVTQIQSESSRSSLSQAIAADKPINITRPEGHQQLAERVRWMVNARIQQADIRVDPPELGAMKIKVNLSGEAANISFTVQSTQARDALEQAVPRLREMLSEQGIQLGQSDIQQQQNRESDAEQGQFAGRSEQASSNDEDDLAAPVQQRVVNGSLGGIDYYV